MTEIQIQADCYQWAHNHIPQIRGLLFHVPNGGSRNVIEGMQLKASGVVSGIPDLILLWAGKVYGLECKTPKGTVSPEQLAIHALWRAHGVTVHVFRSRIEFEVIINSIINQ